jgi:hypothetical protein
MCVNEALETINEEYKTLTKAEVVYDYDVREAASAPRGRAFACTSA